MSSRLPLFYLLIFLVCSFPSYTQISNFDIEYPYKGKVAKMQFDNSGYFWFHDYKDFYKYNGHQTYQVGLNALLGQKNDDYFLYGKIVFVQDSILFLNTNKISLLDPESNTITDVWQLPGRNYFKFLYQDEADNIWVFASTWDNKSQPVYRSTDGKNFVKVFDLNDHVGDQGVFWTYYELDDKDGHLYFLWRKGDMLMIDYDGNQVELDVADLDNYLSTKSCSQFRLDNQKRLWRIHNTDFTIYDESTKSFQSHELTGKLEFITDCKVNDEKLNKRDGLAKTGSMLNLKYIFSDHKDRIWLSCAASYLVCYDPSIDDFINFRQPLVDALESGDSDIEELLEDNDNNIWGFKEGGVFKIKEIENYFDSYLVNTKSKDHSLHTKRNSPNYKKVRDYYNDYAVRNTAIHSISEDSEGRLIFQEGVYTFRLDLNSKHLKILPVFSPIESVHISYNEFLKIYGVWGSYYKLSENFTAQKMSKTMLKLENTLIQKNGDIWISGLLSKKSYLFAKLDPKTLDFNGTYIDPAGKINFATNHVNSMSEDSDGNLWLGTLEGLIHFDIENDSFSHFGDTYYYQSDSLQIATSINHVEDIGDGRIWFSTNFEVGLLDTKTKSLIHYLTLDPNNIGQNTKLVSHGDSVIWIGHRKGLTYHNFKNDKSISVSSEEGLITNNATNVLKKLKNGQIAAGTNNGLYIYHPDSLLKSYGKLQEYQQNIPLSLNSYSIIEGDTDSLFKYSFFQDTIDEIVLDYNDKMLELEYAILNFNYPDRHLFSYKLDGYDKDWSKPSQNNKAIYTSLPAGSYTFQAKATSGSGIWSNNIISVPITINQAWYYSLWFILSVIGIFALMTYLITRYYYKEKLAKQIAIEKLRTKISNDLHDDVGSILSGLAMKSEVISLSQKGEIKDDLLEISKQSRTVMGKMRDIVWAMNPERDKYENLLDRMRSFAMNQFKNTSMSYDIEFINIKMKKELKPDVRQNLYFIFKEAITNAIKHSNGDMVKIKLHKENNNVILSIKDNGTAKNQVPSDGLGLSSIKARAKMINANLTINPSPNYEVRLVI